MVESILENFKTIKSMDKEHSTEMMEGNLLANLRRIIFEGMGQDYLAMAIFMKEIDIKVRSMDKECFILQI